MTERNSANAAQRPLDAALGQDEEAIADNGFSDSVMARLPRRRIGLTTARNWTLASAAVTGSALTALLASPLEAAFSSLIAAGAYQLPWLLALAFVGLLTIPVAWAFYSK